MKSVKNTALAGVCAALAVAASFPASNAAPNNGPNHLGAVTIAARIKYFGAENVDSKTGNVRDDRVILSWTTNASEAVSIKGRIILLDTYINRPELPPAPGEADLRRSPLSPQEMIDLNPEAIFLGHGHNDHAGNAAYIAKWLDIPISTQRRKPAIRCRPTSSGWPAIPMRSTAGSGSSPMVGR